MKPSIQVFSIQPPPSITMIFAWGVVAALIGLMLYFMTTIEGMGWLMGSIFLPIIVVFIIVAMATKKTRFELSSKGLEITGDWCGETVLWKDIHIAEAWIIRFAEEPGMKPKWKLIGLAMPGYCSGWFRLQNKSKALIFLTDKTEAVLIPTRNEYVVLLSATDNHGLLDALKQRPELNRSVCAS